MQHESNVGTVYNLASFGAVVDTASNRGALVFNTYDTSETEAFRVTHDGNLNMTRNGYIRTSGQVNASAFYDDGVLLTPDTFNTTADMRGACNQTPLNLTLGYNYSWFNLMDVPAGFWDGTDAGADTWNTTQEMRTACNTTALNASLYYNYSWFNIMNIPAGLWDGADADTDTWNTTAEMRAACNTTALNASLYFNYSFFNLSNIPANLDTDSTNDLTTATNFAGDVSNTYGAMIVADNSHNHTAVNITPGTFGNANYTFPQGLIVQNNLSVNNCITFASGFKIGSCG
jgi:hypothetical protein